MEYLSVEEKDTWGMGLLIFCHVGHKTMEGMKNRHLPMLEETKFSVGKCKTIDRNLKKTTSNVTMKHIETWVTLYVVFFRFLPIVLNSST